MAIEPRPGSGTFTTGFDGDGLLDLGAAGLAHVIEDEAAGLERVAGAPPRPITAPPTVLALA